MARKMTTAERTELLAKVSQVFSPAAPINRRDLFAGRIDQLQRVFDAVATRGQHATIFGERGVGKTSLANIVQEVAQNSFGGAGVVKVNCAKVVNFATIWRAALARIDLLIDSGESTVGLRPERVEHTTTAAASLAAKVTPHDILLAVERLGKTVIIFDEFDRLRSGRDKFADVIKTLSDSSVDCTLVIVGVANNINGLIKEHASIDRSLAQILMPRMEPSELHEILEKAMTALSMKMGHAARNFVVVLSHGLPHYTHVLGKASTIEALRDSRWEITTQDVNKSITAAIENTEQSIRDSYQTATMTARRDTLFKQVLLACRPSRCRRPRVLLFRRCTRAVIKDHEAAL